MQARQFEQQEQMMQDQEDGVDPEEVDDEAAEEGAKTEKAITSNPFTEDFNKMVMDLEKGVL